MPRALALATNDQECWAQGECNRDSATGECDSRRLIAWVERVEGMATALRVVLVSANLVINALWAWLREQ